MIGGKYRPLATLGSGVNSTVYRAQDTFLDRPVALKLLPVRARADLEDVDRQMRRGVKLAGRLAHPNIVTVHDAGLEGEDIYVVMELVEGQTLEAVLRERGALARRQAIDVILEALEALSYAHDRGVVHGDLRPSNLFLTPRGGAKVADFGLANLISLAASERIEPTVTTVGPGTDGVVMRTIGYMAPEQMQGRSVDHRADLYALGGILFRMLHGKSLSRVVSPFVRAAFLDTEQPPQELPELPGDRRLNRVLERALAPSLKRRYASCETFAEELAAARRAGWRRFLPFSRSR